MMKKCVKPVDRFAYPMALALIGLLLAFASGAYAAGAPSKPKVAVFPLAGEASPAFREKVGFALRRKLDREGHYEVIDGPAMTDLVADEKPPVDFSSDPARVTALGRQAEATVLLWGEVDPIDGSKGGRLRLKWLDLRDKSPAVRQIEKEVNEPTDLRFVTEQVAEALPGVKAFEHPKENDQAVQHDAQAEAMWKSGANLVTNGEFDEAGHWQALYESQAYPPPLSDALPEVDKVAIYRRPLGEGKNENVLTMNLSRYCAENNGMACLSDAIAIEPNTRYRLQFRYRSDGPRLHVFVKGYTRGKDINGKETLREIYRRQVPPSEATDGQWVTITDELNPQQQTFAVDCLKIDLYAYLHPGVVMFDDVVLKAVGKQTDKVGGAAFQQPVTRPK